MNTVEDLPLNARSLAFRWNGLRYTLTLEAETLKVDYDSATYSKSEKSPLDSLSPDLRRERWVPDSAWRNGKEARYLLLLAVIVYFSKLHEFIPLLAPVSLAMGLILVVQGVRRSLPLVKTNIYTEDNDHVISIPHFKHLDQQRRSFEEALVRQIKAARGDAAD